MKCPTCLDGTAEYVPNEPPSTGYVLRACEGCRGEALTVHDDLEQRTDQWYAVRRGLITASSVGALLTPTLKVAANDYSRGLTINLAAERITGITEETYVSDDMWRGIEAEPIARKLYGEHHAEAVEVGFMVRSTPTWTLGYSPDGLVGDDGLIEIKAPRAKGHINTILADAVPTGYMAQCQAALLVSGRKWLDYVSYCAGLPLYVKRVDPDPAWQDALVLACEVFELNVAQIVSDFTTATADLPATERDALEIRV